MSAPISPRPGYLAQPTIHHDTVVFCCADDLWLVPAAGGPSRRLTSAMSRTCTPRLSADGELIAFRSHHDGPAEVYVMPTAGGTARRLTYDAARCSVIGWHPDTGEVVYASSARQPAAFGLRLFAVSPDGGVSRLLPFGRASTVSFGPGGGVVLGCSIADPARRKRYRGGAAGQLWIRATAGAEFTQLSVPGNPVDPCWVEGRIYFLTDHEGTANVYSMLPDGSGLSAHTDHTDYYARNLTTDGQRLVYQCGAELHLLDPSAGRSHPIEVQVASSGGHQARRFVAAADYLDGARLSPDGRELSLVSRGKAFTFAHWSGPVRQHGADGVRYTHADRLADGDRLVAVAADSRPGEHLAILRIGLAAAEVELCLDEIGCVTELRASPTSGLVAFATNRQQLWLVDTAQDQPQPRLVDASPHERIEDLAWSFDGRWLAYTYPGTPRTSVIRVVEVLTAQIHNVTEPVFRDCRPAFDPSGRYLYFIGQRDLTPDLDQVQFDVGFPFGARPYVITLRTGDPAPFVPGQLLRPPTTAGAAPLTEIDFPGIERRVVALPVAEGRYAAVLGLSDRVLLLRVPVSAPDPVADNSHPEGTVSSVDLATGEVTADYLDGIDEISTDARGGAVLYRSGTRLRVLAGDTVPEAAAELNVPWAVANRGSGWLDLNRVLVPLRPETEWRQMFREAWRLQREAYWDRAMSGIDWPAMYERYSPLVDLIGCRAELSDLLWELHGELATSHAYERGGDYGTGAGAGRPPPGMPAPPGQGFLGVDWCEPEPDGEPPVWRIADVLRGAPWNPAATSPCNRPGVDISAGDQVLAINGQPLGPSGPGELLVGQAGREVELTLARTGSPTRRVCVRATGDESRARYLDWVERNRAYVHDVSGGRLGYLHVPDMFAGGYADFVLGFLAELDRDGLVVDVRFNGGGYASPLLIDRLARRRAGTEHGRWSGAVPYPMEAPHGPMVVVMNEETGSDTELFAHVFRSRGLGPLVGCRTWGGTIATWSRHHLADGTETTQPEFCYDLSGVGMSLENRGVQPDVNVQLGLVPGRCGDGLGEDAQLAAAVRCLNVAVRAPQPSAGPGQWSGPPARAAAADGAGHPADRPR